LALYCAHPEYYPDYLQNGTGRFENLIPTFGDSMDRMIWRTRQSLDYMFLWSLGTKMGKYFLQIEDDVLDLSSKNILLSVWLEKYIIFSKIEFFLSKSKFFGKNLIFVKK